MIRIDSHQHLWRLDRGDYGWLTAEALPSIYRDYGPDDLLPLLRHCGIHKTVLVQCAETVAETDFLLDLADANDFIGAVVGWVDLASAGAVADIARLSRNPKLAGLRPMLQSLPEDNWILRPELAPAIDAMQANGLRFDALIFPRHLPAITTFLERYPQLPVVIDHGAKPRIAEGEIDEWTQQMKHIADHTHALCKISGLATEAAAGWTSATLKPYVDVLLDVFGPERLMWGSDWPVLNLAGEYTAWFDIAQQLTGQLSAAESELLFGATAARFYGIAIDD